MLLVAVEVAAEVEFHRPEAEASQGDKLLVKAFPSLVLREKVASIEDYKGILVVSDEVY